MSQNGREFGALWSRKFETVKVSRDEKPLDVMLLKYACSLCVMKFVNCRYDALVCGFCRIRQWIFDDTDKMDWIFFNVFGRPQSRNMFGIYEIYLFTLNTIFFSNKLANLFLLNFLFDFKSVPMKYPYRGLLLSVIIPNPEDSPSIYYHLQHNFQ